MTQPSDHVDVLIVGAGLSGIGAACHLADRRARHAAYAILEARDAIGGTWDLFRYPGVRSDSDMFTLGYRVPAVDRATRRSPTARRSSATSARPRGVRRRRATSATATGRRARLVVGATRRWTVDGRAGRRRRSPSPAASSGLQRLLRLRRGLHPGLRRASRTSRAGRAPPALARGPRPTPASGWW